MEGLTDKQRAIWELMGPEADGGRGMTRVDAARILGVSVNYVAKVLKTVRVKLGKAAPGKETGPAKMVV